MNEPSGNDLRAAHRAFHRDAERRERAFRAALLTQPMIGDSSQTVQRANHSTDAQERPVREQSTQAAPRRRFRLNRRWLTAAVAASLFATMWFAFSGVEPQQAYGVIGVREKLLACKNMRVKGRRFQPGKNGQLREIPFEWYVERPGFYWYSTGTTSEDGFRSYIASNGRRHIYANTETNTATVRNDSPFAAEIFGEQMIQEWIVGGVLGDSPGEYVALGVDTANGVRCDVYEKVFRLEHGWHNRQEVWVERASGLPIKATTFRGKADRHEVPLVTIDAIGADLAERPDLASLSVPPGFNIKQDDSPARDIGLMTFIETGDERFELRLALLIDHGAVLVCWAYQDNSEKQDAPNEMVFTPTGAGRPFAHHRLRRTSINNRDWNWSLFVPGGHDASHYENHETYLLHVGLRNGPQTKPVHPLKFDKERLADVILQAQSSAKPRPTPNEPNTLEELRAIIQGDEVL